MHAADSSCLYRIANVYLQDAVIQPLRLKLITAKNPGKKTPFVFYEIRLDDKCAGNRRIEKFHRPADVGEELDAYIIINFQDFNDF